MKFTYSLYEVQPKVYLVETDNVYDVSMIFWRAQEYYESSNPSFQGGSFTLLEYMDWYSKTYSEDHCFTYSVDYVGFNVPSDVILQCYTDNVERTPYDEFMLRLTRDIFFMQGGGRFYLIGAARGDMSTLNHEMAHGFFYTDKDYRQHMTALVNELPCKKEMSKILSEMMYAKNIHTDEIQAFFSTGLAKEMKHLKQYTKPFVAAFKRKRGKFKLPTPIKTETIDLFQRK